MGLISNSDRKANVESAFEPAKEWGASALICPKADPWKLEQVDILKPRSCLIKKREKERKKWGSASLPPQKQLFPSKHLPYPLLLPPTTTTSVSPHLAAKQSGKTT